MMGTAMHMISLGLLAVCFAGFSLASFRHFRAGESLGNTAIRVMTFGASVWFAVICLTAPHPPAHWSIVALALSLASFTVFLGSLRSVPDGVLDVAFTGTGPDRLIRHGIYRRVRHPLYLSYLLYWAAWACASQFAWPTVLGLGAFGLIYWVAARQEETYLAGRFPVEYAAHKRMTGLFWPILVLADDIEDLEGHP